MYDAKSLAVAVGSSYKLSRILIGMIAAVVAAVAGALVYKAMH